ncbi:hypothetical protein EJB05_57418, partial [Eragrostis curvula]
MAAGRAPHGRRRVRQRVSSPSPSTPRRRTSSPVSPLSRLSLISSRDFISAVRWLVSIACHTPLAMVSTGHRVARGRESRRRNDELHGPLHPSALLYGRQWKRKRRVEINWKTKEAEGGGDADGYGKAAFGVLTLNSGLAIYRAWEDLASVLFVAGSYLTLLLLFGCLRTYERAQPGSPARERARRAVWPLTTLLTVGFAWKVAALMPPAVAVLVWGLAIATVAGGYFALYVHA